MREPDLRPVLLVKAIEEADTDATLLPLADRAAAARDAKREAPPEAPLRLEEGLLPAAGERLLVLRARRLLTQLEVRHPFIRDILDFAPGRWLWGMLCITALAAGLALSALDGSHRINVLAFPLWGVVLWNFIVFAVVLLSWVRKPKRGRFIPDWVARSSMSRATALIARARRFDAPLTESLMRFAAEWQELARPVMTARVAAMFHAAAALLGAGLIAGFYIRGVALDYRAGWESTFLDADRVRSVLGLLYGPASAITGVSIPDAAHLEAMHWREGRGGENAAPWIHLLAATTLLYVVVPRLILAMVAWLQAAHAARSLRLPSSMAGYFGRTFREAGVMVEGGAMRVIPYAYEPAADVIERLRARFPDAVVDVRSAVAYGREDAISSAIAAGETPGLVTLLFTSAATPEEDSHGRVIDHAREAARLRATRLDAIVDEGPYAERMGADLAPRMEERRRAWSRLIAAHGIEARFMDLSK